MRGSQGNSIFQTQQAGYTYEVTEAGAAHTRQVQARWDPIPEKGTWTQSSLPDQKVIGN